MVSSRRNEFFPPLDSSQSKKTPLLLPPPPSSPSLPSLVSPLQRTERSSPFNSSYPLLLACLHSPTLFSPPKPTNAPRATSEADPSRKRRRKKRERRRSSSSPPACLPSSLLLPLKKARLASPEGTHASMDAEGCFASCGVLQKGGKGRERER